MSTKPACLLLAAIFTIAAVSQVRAANTGTPPFFQEVFSFPLQDYFCENHLSVADVDGDGRQDIVLMATSLSETSGPPWHYRSRAILLHAEADGSFTDSTITNFAGRYGYGAVTADLNNDAAPDLILREQSATHVLLNDGHGVFQEVWTGQPGYYNLAAVDVNHDGFLDIVSGTQTGSGGLIELFTNDGTGTSFEKAWQSRLYGSGYDSIQTVLSVNLNNDGEMDIAAREIYSGLLVTLRGTPSGNSFVEQNVMSLGDRTFALAGGRVNGDAVTDLAAYVGWGTVRVFANQGNGSLAEYWQSPDLGQAAFNLAMADFDRDGFDDIFVGTFADGALRIYRNHPGAGFDLWWQGSIPGTGYTGSVADLNGDGYPDLIVGDRDRIRIFINRVGIPLFIGNVTVTERNAGTANAEFTVSLLTNHFAVVSVDFATADGSATAGSDYVPTNGTLLFNPGETTKTIAVPVLGDALTESNEAFFVRLSNPTNISLAQTQALGTIFNDDGMLANTQTVIFADWTSLDLTNNFAVGTLDGIPITFFGDTNLQFSEIDGSSTRFSCEDFSPPLPHSDAIYLAGTPTARSYTFVFGEPVRDPVIHLQTLASQLTFSNAVTRLNGTFGFTVAGNTVSGALTSDLGVCGNDSRGTIRLCGIFYSLSFNLQYTDSIDGIRLQLGGTVVRRLALAPDGSGGFFIRFNGITGLAYQLQRATSVTGPWTSNATATALASGFIEFHDTNAPPGSAFYRTAAVP